MSYAERVANVLGVELCEEFKIKISGEKFLENEYRFSCDGDRVLEAKVKDKWVSVAHERTLEKLICGDYEIVKDPFKPVFSEAYYFFEGTEVKETAWLDEAYDFAMWKVGNCFKTKKEAETKGKEILEKLRKEYEGDC